MRRKREPNIKCESRAPSRPVYAAADGCSPRGTQAARSGAHDPTRDVAGLRGAGDECVELNPGRNYQIAKEKFGPQ